MKSKLISHRFLGLSAIAAVGLLLGSCGGGDSTPTSPTGPAAPLVWSQPQATWDNVSWQ